MSKKQTKTQKKLSFFGQIQRERTNMQKTAKNL